MDVTTEDLAYLAGLIDGEGCVTMCAIRRPNRHPQARLYLDVAGTRPEIVEWIHQRFDGTVWKATARRVGHADVFHWRLSGHAVVKLLLLVRPYLRIKRRLAVLAIAWERHAPGRGHLDRRWDEGVIGVLHRGTHALNARGVARNEPSGSAG